MTNRKCYSYWSSFFSQVRGWRWLLHRLNNTIHGVEHTHTHLTLIWKTWGPGAPAELNKCIQNVKNLVPHLYTMTPKTTKRFEIRFTLLFCTHECTTGSNWKPKQINIMHNAHQSSGLGPPLKSPLESNGNLEQVKQKRATTNGMDRVQDPTPQAATATVARLAISRGKDRQKTTRSLERCSRWRRVNALLQSMITFESHLEKQIAGAHAPGNF